MKGSELISIVQGVLRLPACTPKLLRVLSSLLINAFLTRTPLMDHLEAVSGCEGDASPTVIVILERVIQELAMSIFLLFLAPMDLKGGVDPVAGCLDASEARGVSSSLSRAALGSAPVPPGREEVGDGSDFRGLF